ncbi:MAG: ABC transporter substrate-binding protein, partial [Dehalococcoidales bacterium]|nr:ABC transporter substrate-binding protein [Dehalococcoidales bacterium]
KPLPQIAPSTEWGYIPDLPVRSYNPAKAKQLLAEAGYPNGVQVKMLIQNLPASIDAGQALKQYLDQAGFKTELDVADPGRYFASVFGTGWKDLAYMFYGMNNTNLEMYISWFSIDPKSNLASFGRTEYQQKRDKEVVLIADKAQQEAATADLMRHLYEEARLCPLWWVPATTVQYPYVHHEIYKHGFIRWDTENFWMDPH